MRSLIARLKRFFALEHNVKVLWYTSALGAFGGSLTEPAFSMYIVKMLKGSATVLGLFSSITNAVSTFIATPSGWLADKLGRKKVIVAGWFLAALPPILYTLIDRWEHLVPIVAIGALGIGLRGPAVSALIADSTSAANRATAFGVFNLSWLIGQLPGPILGGFLADYLSLKAPFYVGFLILLFCPILSLKLIEPRKPHKTVAKGRSNADAHSKDEVYEALMPVRMVLLLFCLIGLLNGIGNGILQPVLIMYLIEKLNVSTLEIGLVSSVGFALTALVQIPGGKVADRFGRRPILIVSSIVSTPLLAIWGHTNTLYEFIAILALLCAFGNISQPGASALFMDLIPPEERARASGLRQTTWGVGGLIGPIIGGILWETYGSEMPFYVFALLNAVSIPLLLMLKEPKRVDIRS